MKNLKNAVLTALMIFSLTSNVSAIFNKDGNLPIHKAVKRGDLPKIKKIIEEDPNSINSQNKLGQTPLMLAICWKSGKTTINRVGDEYFVEDLDPKDIRDKMIKYFIEQGADVNILDFNGASCLHYLMRDSRIKLDYSFRLIAVGANVNVTDNRGETVLEIFSNIYLEGLEDHKYAFMLLLYAGAELTNKINKSTLDKYKQFVARNESLGIFKNVSENFVDIKSLELHLKYGDYLKIDRALIKSFFN